MASQGNSLLDKISQVDNEFSSLLEAAGITEDNDIKELCFDSLKDILPGGGRKILQRSRVWKVIQESLKGSSELKCASSTPGYSSQDESVMCTPNSHCSSLSSLEQDKTTTPSLETVPVFSVNTKHPQYAIYSDADVIAGAKSGTIAVEIRNRLVRGTIHNMISTASSAPFNRSPNTSELEEMAKSLIIAYPCLRDVETGHGVLFKQLKRRMSNTKPVKKPQGPCPKKRKYAKKTEDIIQPQVVQKLQFSGSSNLESSEADHGNDMRGSDYESDLVDDQGMMERHLKAAKREMEKKNPNKDVLNGYLNKLFPSRRDWLRKIPASERCGKLLDVYPCFRDHVEVIEEARRVLKVDSEEREAFMSDCVDRLTTEIDSFIYYGMDTKSLKPPKSTKINDKIIYVLNNLSVLFGNKSKPLKKTFELIRQLKDGDDLNSFCEKRGGNVPVLVVDDEDVYVLVGKCILVRVKLTNLSEAAVAFLATFYLLDFYYPKQCEVGLSMLQFIILADKCTQTEINSTLTAYQEYKNRGI